CTLLSWVSNFWGAVQSGEAGVAHLLRLFAEDMKVTMTLTGATSPSAISLDCLDRLEQDQYRTHAVPVSLPA
ncbi:TPA: alpha-hydroxy-acid oxidizing protein, partial [Klebsiella pneumoniae]|nr:alpha-hydroxy-acid oxidizing protein [Klebsiella pneumoniae]HDZ1598498.1 alpha-hydroxy-acid oxidizing protein [Klebsiella pneumoniae]